MIKSVTTAACVLALTTTFAFAQAGGAPGQAPNSGQDNMMKKDGMAKDKMGTTGTSGMAKDSMSKDGMKKDTSKDNKPVDGMKK